MSSQSGDDWNPNSFPIRSLSMQSANRAGGGIEAPAMGGGPRGDISPMRHTNQRTRPMASSSFLSAPGRQVGGSPMPGGLSRNASGGMEPYGSRISSPQPESYPGMSRPSVRSPDPFNASSNSTNRSPYGVKSKNHLAKFSSDNARPIPAEPFGHASPGRDSERPRDIPETRRDVMGGSRSPFRSSNLNDSSFNDSSFNDSQRRFPTFEKKGSFVAPGEASYSSSGFQSSTSSYSQHSPPSTRDTKGVPSANNSTTNFDVSSSSFAGDAGVVEMDPYPSLNSSASGSQFPPPERKLSRRTSKKKLKKPPVIAPMPLDPPGPTEPSIPERQRISRRFKHYQTDRVADICMSAKVVKNNRYKQGDDGLHVLICPACRNFLKLPKLSVLMQCPTCSTVSPATSSSN